MSFKDLKKKSSLGALTQKLVKEVEKLDTAGSSGDDRFWKLECDKAQNGSAVIRFLPPPDGEDMPFVKLHSHYFKGPAAGIHFPRTYAGSAPQTLLLEATQK